VLSHKILARMYASGSFHLLEELEYGEVACAGNQGNPSSSI
jgi:hypothetical protein